VVLIGEACIFIVVPHEASFTHNNENESDTINVSLSRNGRGAGVRVLIGEACIFIVVYNRMEINEMIPTHRVPTHPGVILKEEYLDPLGISQAAFAQHVGLPAQRINELIRGKRGVTPETAWLLAQALNTTPEFWTNLQTAHDLAKNRPHKKIDRIKAATT
jgi:antitoxin HigA-1